MNRFNLAFTAARLPVDAIALVLASAAAYLLRYSRFATDVRPLLQDIPLTSYIQMSLAFVGVWILMFLLAGLYVARPLRAWNELGRLIVACTAGIMVVIATIFFRRELTQSRFIIIAIWAFSIFFAFGARTILRLIRQTLLRHGWGHERLALIGANPQADKLADLFARSPMLGMTIVRRIPEWTAASATDLDVLVQADHLDGLLLADPDLPKSATMNPINYANRRHLSFRYLADVFAARFTNIEVSTPGGIPIIEVKRTPLDGWGRIAKRAMDVLIAVLLLTLSAPVLLLAAVAILIEDGGPILFKNERIGERGRAFFVYKLRTMYKRFSIGPQFADAEKNLALEERLIREKNIKQGPVYKIADDPRVMRIGAFLRRWSIDEIPNFLNVLRGDLSLVGPRPHQPREVEHYTDTQRRVLAIKPGVTGLAQISGRSDLTFDEEVRLDTWYIENWSPFLDLYVMLKTPGAVLRRTGAY